MAGFRIFIAEDNSADVFLIEHALGEHQVEFDLTVAKDGEAALDSLRNSKGERQLPDLFLLDLNLPKIHGLTVLEAIRVHPEFAETPVGGSDLLLFPRGAGACDRSWSH